MYTAYILLSCTPRLTLEGGISLEMRLLSLNICFQWARRWRDNGTRRRRRGMEKDIRIFAPIFRRRSPIDGFDRGKNQRGKTMEGLEAKRRNSEANSMGSYKTKSTMYVMYSYLRIVKVGNVAATFLFPLSCNCVFAVRPSPIGRR